MKLMKRLTALVLSAAMVLSMSVTALATGGDGSADTYTWYEYKQTTQLEECEFGLGGNRKLNIYKNGKIVESGTGTFKLGNQEVYWNEDGDYDYVKVAPTVPGKYTLYYFENEDDTPEASLQITLSPAEFTVIDNENGSELKSVTVTELSDRNDIVAVIAEPITIPANSSITVKLTRDGSNLTMKPNAEADPYLSKTGENTTVEFAPDNKGKYRTATITPAANTTVGASDTFTYIEGKVTLTFTVTIGEAVVEPYYELRDANGNAITDLGKEPVTAYLYHVNGEDAVSVENLSYNNLYANRNENSGDIIVEPSADGKSVQLIPVKSGTVKIIYIDADNKRHTVEEYNISGINYQLRDLNGNVITTIGADPVYAVLYNNDVPVDLNGEKGLNTNWDDTGRVNVTYQNYVVGETTYQTALLTGVRNGTVNFVYNRYYYVNPITVAGVVSYDLYTSTDNTNFEPYDNSETYWGTTYFKVKNDSNNEWVDIKNGFLRVEEGNNYNDIDFIDNYTMKVELCAALPLSMENGMKFRISPAESALVFTEGANRLKEISRSNLQPFNTSIKDNGNGNFSKVNVANFKMLNEDREDFTDHFTIVDKSDLSPNSTRVQISAKDTLPNGIYTIEYTDTFPNRNGINVTCTATMKFIYSGKGVSYLLTDEKAEALFFSTDQTNDGQVTKQYAVVVYKFIDGIADSDISDQIKSIELKAKDNNRNDAIGDENAAKCIYLGTNSEGKQVICTTNAVKGHYTVTATITMEDGTTFNQTITYICGDHSSAGNTYYVGTQAGDYGTIQQALNAVNKDTLGGTWTVIIRDGEYSENIDFTIDNTVYRDMILIKGEGDNAVIKGTLNLSVKDKSDENKSNNSSKYNLYIQGLSFVDDDASKTAITIDPYMTFNSKHGVSLQDIGISGYATGIYGTPDPENSRAVTISNCDTALVLRSTQFDVSRYVYREWNFIDNDVAINLNNAKGQFKIRDSQFSGNDKNIVADSTSCAVVNAAFNNYLHNGVNPGESIDSYFSLKDDNAKYFYSPYTSKSTASRAATSDFYIDPAQMKGLIIDAEEAKQVVNSSNFKGQDIVIDIVTTTENEDTGFTTSEAYATWNFGTDVTANAVAMDFTPRIDRELTEASLAVVEAEGIESYQPVSFAHSGDLPAVATVELNETVALNGDLYLYKVVGSELVLQEEGVTYENGIYTFDRPTCSDYIITDTEIKNEDDSDNDDQGGSGDNTGSGENDKPSQGGSFTPSDDSNNYIPVNEVKNKLNNTSKDTVTLNVENRDQLSAKIFEELAKHPEKTLVLKGDGYTLSIKGDDVVRKLSSSIFDADIRNSSPNRSKIRKLIGSDVNVQFIHSDFHGMLPGEMTLRIKVEDSLNGKLLNLYHYNEKLDELELVASDLKVDNKGYVEVRIDHFSTYILTDSKLNANSSVSVEKTNPSTGANDMVALAAAMAVVSVMGVAVLNRKR